MGSTGYMMATRLDATHFTYPLAVQLTITYRGGAVWVYGARYNVRLRKVYNSTLVVTGTGSGYPTYYSYDLDYDGEANHLNNIMRGINVSMGFRLPSDRTNLASWKFVNCGGALDAFGLGVANPDGHMVLHQPARTSGRQAAVGRGPGIPDHRRPEAGGRIGWME